MDINRSEEVVSTKNTAPTTSNATLLVIIIAWLLLLQGIVGLLAAILGLTIAGVGKDPKIFGIGLLGLLIAVSLIVVSFGLRHMKRWALYTYTTVVAIGGLIEIYRFATSPTHSLMTLGDIVIQGLLLFYLWTISKKFGK